MLKIENTETYGWEASIRGLRNPMNSWEKSDSECLFHMVSNYAEDDPMAKEYCRYIDEFGLNLKLGESDHNLMMRMNHSPEESKYRRMITVTMDVIAPLYWWKEFDTYKVGTVCNSCSTMHKIHAKEFTLDDFSHEHMNADCLRLMDAMVNFLNDYRNLYLETKDKSYWWQMIQLLPTSYNQRRTIQLNYEVLSQIYRQRKNHKLDEWHTFCDWIKSLPYSELITGSEK